MKYLILFLFLMPLIAFSEDDNVYFGNGISAETSSGPQQFPAGILAAPSITFGDPTSGIYSTGTNSVAIVSNGSSVIQFSPGSVTISSALPSTSMPVTAGDLSNVGSSVNMVSAATNSNIATLGFTTGVAVKGANLVSQATAGYIGEYAFGSLPVATNCPATTHWTDLTSFSLTAGDWDINLNAAIVDSGATTTSGFFGISTTSGDNATGLTNGDNEIIIQGPSVTNVNSPAVIPGYRVQPTSTTTYYAKVSCVFAAGTPQYIGRMSARRMR